MVLSNPPFRRSIHIWINLKLGLRSSDLKIYPYIYGENLELLGGWDLRRPKKFNLRTILKNCRLSQAKKRIVKLMIGKWKDRSYMIENLWLNWKIDFWRPINWSWSKIIFWSESLSRFTLVPNAAKSTDYIAKWFKQKMDWIEFSTKNLAEA